MKIFVDTSVWSAALRRSPVCDTRLGSLLRDLIAGQRIQMIGPIRQEILSGIREKSKFEALKKHLAVFPDVAIQSADYVMATSYFNRCRSLGVQGSNTDYLICAVAVRTRMHILTTDHDFQEY